MTYLMIRYPCTDAVIITLHPVIPLQVCISPNTQRWAVCCLECRLKASSAYIKRRINKPHTLLYTAPLKPPISNLKLGRLTRLSRVYLLIGAIGLATFSVTAKANVDTDNSANVLTPMLINQGNTAFNPSDIRPSLLAVMQAEFATDRGNLPTALQLYKQQAFKNDATSVFERALSLSMRYEPVEDSLAFARAWQLKNPQHLPAQFYVVHLALKAYDYELAGEVLTQILAYDPQADLSEILIGISPTAAADQRSLLDTLQSLPDHENPSLMVMQAGLMLQLDQPENALVSVTKALKMQPDNIPFITLKADIIKQLMPSQDVLEYIAQQRLRLSNSKALYLYEIRYRLALGQTREAWQLLIEANALFHDDEMTLLAALVSIDIEAYKVADELLSNLAASPHYVDQAYYYLGISAERQQDYSRAERFFAKVMQENLVLKARQKLVAIQLLQQQPERALATLEKFSQQFEIYAPDCAILQAEILRQQNKLAEAQQVLVDANQRFPDDTKLLYAEVQLLDNEQDATLKHQLLDHLLLLDPENIDYQLSLAVLLFENDNQQDNQQALQVARSIIAIPFNHPNYRADYHLTALNILAADALSKQDYQQVRNYLESVYAVSPTLDSGIILLRAYQGLGLDDKVTALFSDIRSRFALGQKDISDRLQSY